MNADKIDKAVYDKDRYKALRDSGVPEDRAKRVATVPLEPKESAKGSNDASLTERRRSNKDLSTKKGASATTVKSEV